MQAGEPTLGGARDFIGVLVDDHQLLRLPAAQQQLGRGDGAAVPESAEDHVIAQVLLQSSHAPFLDDSLDDELVSRAEKDEPHEDPHGRDEERVDQPRRVGHGHDVAVTHGRDGDHREVDDVDQRDVAVDVVLQPAAIEQEDGEHREHEQQHQQRACGERHFGRRGRLSDQDGRARSAALQPDAA